MTLSAIECNLSTMADKHKGTIRALTKGQGGIHIFMCVLNFTHII